MGRLVHDLRIAQPRACLSSQESVVSPRRTAQLTTAMAPVIKRRLRSRWPSSISCRAAACLLDLQQQICQRILIENEAATRRSRLVGKSFE